MRLVVRVKLLPTPEQTQALEATLRACNRAADYVSLIAFESGVQDRNGLQKVVYADVKATFGLSAQPAVRVVKKVVDAYATLAAQLKAGLLGGKGSKRYRKATAPQSVSGWMRRNRSTTGACLGRPMPARYRSGLWTVGCAACATPASRGS